MKYIHEKEIWLVDLEPTKGIEIRKIRPCLIIKKCSEQHLIILPITSQFREERISFRLEKNSFLLKEANYILITQIRTTDKERFLRRLGTIPDPIFESIKKKTAGILLPASGG